MAAGVRGSVMMRKNEELAGAWLVTEQRAGARWLLVVLVLA